MLDSDNGRMDGGSRIGLIVDLKAECIESVRHLEAFM
jgi:hypothetical protein